MDATFTFGDTDAIEMIQHLHPGARVGVQVVDIGNSTVTCRLTVVVNGVEVASNGRLQSLGPGDTVILPEVVRVEVT